MFKRLIVYLIILSMIFTVTPIVNASQSELINNEMDVVVFDAIYEVQYSNTDGFTVGQNTLRIGYSKNIQFAALKFDIGNIPGTITGARLVANGGNAVSSTETAYPIRVGTYPTYLNDSDKTPWNEDNISPYGCGPTYITNEMIVDTMSGEYVVDLSDTLVGTIKPNEEVAFAVYSTASWGLINTRYTSPAGTKGPKLEISYIPNDGDITPPHWDKGEIRVSKETTTGITLEWSGAVDNEEVTGYRIKDGTKIVADNISKTSYTIDNLKDDTDYNFSVQAIDDAGNISTDGPNVKYHKGFSYGGFKLLESCFVINKSPRNLINQKDKTNYLFNWYSLDKAMLYVKVQFDKSDTLDVEKLNLIVPVSRVGQNECEAYIYPVVSSDWDEYTITDNNKPDYLTKEIGKVTVTPSTEEMVFDLKDYITSGGTYTFAIQLSEGHNITLNMNNLKTELEYERTGGANKPAKSLAKLPTLYPVADTSVRPQGPASASITQPLSATGARMYAWPTDKATNYFVVRYEIPEIAGLVKSASLDLTFDFTYGTSDATVDVWKYSAFDKNTGLPWDDESEDIKTGLPSVLGYTPGNGDFKGVLTSAPGQCTINLDAEDIVGDSTIAFVIRVNPGTEPRVFLHAREHAEGSGAKLNIEYEVDQKFDGTAIDDEIAFLTMYRPDTRNDSFIVKLDGATFSKSVLTENVDFVVENLPRGLKVKSAYTLDENRAKFEIGGSANEPISENFQFSVVIKWAALKDTNANSAPFLITATAYDSSMDSLYENDFYDGTVEFWDTECKIIPNVSEWYNLIERMGLLSSENLPDDFVTRGYANQILKNIPRLDPGFDSVNGEIARADDNMRFNEACKVLVTALGYGIPAQDAGGYPVGYLLMANRLGILDNISCEGDEYITFDLFAHLLFNTMNSRLAMGRLSKNSDGSFEIASITLSDTNLLTEAYNIMEYEGTVVSTDGTSVTVRCEPDGHEKMLETDNNGLHLLVGGEATFWINDKENTLVAFYPTSQVKFDYITGYSSDSISTFISGEEIDLASSVEVNVNGQFANLSDITSDMICRIVITKKDVKRIDAFSLIRGGFFNTFSSSNVSYKDYLESETPQYIDTEHKNVYAMLNGVPCDLENLPSNAIIDYYVDSDSIWIFASNLGLIGEVKEFTYNSFVIEDIHYAFDDKWKFSPNMGKEYVTLDEPSALVGSLVRAYFSPSGKARYIYTNIEENVKEFYCVVGSVRSDLSGDFITVLRPSFGGEAIQEYELKLKNSPLSIADIEMRAGERGGADSVMYVELSGSGKVVRVSEPDWALYNAHSCDYPKTALRKFDSISDRIETVNETNISKNFYVKDAVFFSIYDRHGNYDPHVVTWDRMKSRGAVNGMIVRVEASRPYSEVVAVVKGYDMLTPGMFGNGRVTKVSTKLENEDVFYITVTKNGSSKEYFVPKDLSENVKEGDFIEFTKDVIVQDRLNNTPISTGETGEIRIITPIIDVKGILENNIGVRILIEKIDDKFFMLDGEDDYMEVLNGPLVYKYDRSARDEYSLETSKLSDIPIGCKIWFLPIGYDENKLVVYEEVSP